MSKLTRRILLGGAAAGAAVVAVPVAFGGTESFLRRVLADHFGPAILDTPGIDDFVAEYAAGLGGDDGLIKSLGAELYFGWRGDLVKEIGPARVLAERFLHTILARSNIIHVDRGVTDAFNYTAADPWEPQCNLFLSALAEDSYDLERDDPPA